MKATSLIGKAFRYADSDCLLVKMLIVLTFFALLSAPCALCQIPQGFTYQALAFDSSGEPIRNTALPVRISIESDSLGGTLFWQELHSTVTTNGSGMFSLVLGKGVKQAGDAATFSAIDWSVTPKFIRTEIDYGGWKTMGASRLWSVPYAMAAGDISGALKRLEVTGESSVSDDALFEVKNKNGQTVFAVYNEGVRVNVGSGENKAVKGGFAIGSFDETKLEPKDLMVVTRDSVRVYIYDDPLNKAVKGGFAIGGFDETKGTTYDYMLVSPDSIRMYLDQSAGKAVKGGFAIGGFDETKAPLNEYLRVTPDSVRVYIDKSTGKAVKGGFAIGSFDETKAPMQDYLRVTHDSIRMYVTDDPTKAVKGGFAIGSFDETKKGPAVNFTSLTPQNYYIGHSSGAKTTTGQYNSFVGYEAGFENTGGSRNVFVGYLTGRSNTSGTNNLFLGNESGYTNTTGSNNTFVGILTGMANTTGTSNTFIGSYSGRANTQGNNNAFVGFQSGNSNTTGGGNSFIGINAGYTNTTGSFNSFMGFEAGYTNNASYNAFIGYHSGRANTSGQYNAFMGYNTGLSNTTGASNVFIGNEAGRSNIDGSNNVFLGNLAGNTNNASNNLFLGNESGRNNTTGTSNVFIGTQAGYSNTVTSSNVYIGYQASFSNRGRDNVIIGKLADANGNATDFYHNVIIGTESGYNNRGNWNTMLGYQAGYSNVTGASNVLLGNQAGYSNISSSNVYIGYYAGRDNNRTDGQNVFIGRSAGEKYSGWQSVGIGPFAGYQGGGASSGRGNVFIGFQAGYYETGEYKLHISSGKTDLNESLISGDFLNKTLRFDASVTITTKLNSGNYGGFAGNVNAYSFEAGGPAPSGTNGQATIFFHHHGSIAHQLRYTSGTLYLEAANGYGSSTTPGLSIGGALYAGVNGGNVGIGTTTTSNKLEVAGTARFRSTVSGYVATIYNDGNTSAYNGLNIIAGTNATGAGGTFIRFQRPNTALPYTPVTTGSIQQLDANTVIYNTTSDERLKENIVDSHYSINDLMKVKVRDYNFKSDEAKKTQTGFIAQELFDVYPNAVSRPYSEDDLWQLDYGRITPLIIKAIQDQQQIIVSQGNLIEKQNQECTSLKSELQILKAEVEALKAMILNGNK